MKTKTQKNPQAMDAGLLREYIAERYGAILSFGGDGHTYHLAMCLAKRLARMTGIDLEEIIAAIRSDYEAMEAGR